jgi:hypothetical protein
VRALARDDEALSPHIHEHTFVCGALPVAHLRLGTSHRAGSGGERAYQTNGARPQFVRVLGPAPAGRVAPGASIPSRGCCS